MFHAFDVLQERRRATCRRCGRSRMPRRTRRATSYSSVCCARGCISRSFTTIEGHTLGIATLENLLEELVGDIRDEHDEPDRGRCRRWIVRGVAPVGSRGACSTTSRPGESLRWRARSASSRITAPGSTSCSRRLHPRIGRGRRLGITGPPGAGKSTLTAALRRRLPKAGPHRRRRRGRSDVAVHGRRAAGRSHPHGIGRARSRRIHPLDGDARFARRTRGGDGRSGRRPRCLRHRSHHHRDRRRRAE